MYPIGLEVPPNCRGWLTELDSKMSLPSGAPISGRPLSLSTSIISCHEWNLIWCAYPPLHGGLFQIHIHCCNPLLKHNLLHHLFQRFFHGVSCAIKLNIFLSSALIHLTIFNIMQCQKKITVYSRVIKIYIYLFP